MNLSDWQTQEEIKQNKGILPAVSDVRLLKNAIGHFIHMYASNCDAKTKGFMTMALTFFVQDAVEKFDKGQKEHGGDFLTVDFDREMRQEFLDFFWYNAGKTYTK